MKKNLGVVNKNTELLTEMFKKVIFPLLWRCNLCSKIQSTISRPILCGTWWDSVLVKSYPRCFGTPNLILIRWEMTEIWDLVHFTGQKGSFKWDFKNEPLYGWRPQFLDLGIWFLDMLLPNSSTQSHIVTLGRQNHWFGQDKAPKMISKIHFTGFNSISLFLFIRTLDGLILM